LAGYIGLGEERERERNRRENIEKAMQKSGSKKTI
jgi:hypothetical protein